LSILLVRRSISITFLTHSSPWVRTRSRNRLCRDREHEPAALAQVLGQVADLAAQRELLRGVVGDDGEAVVAHRADLRAVGVQQVAAQGGEGLLERGRW
jgi:hypothetical protein